MVGSSVARVYRTGGYKSFLGCVLFVTKGSGLVVPRWVVVAKWGGPG